MATPKHKKALRQRQLSQRSSEMRRRKELEAIKSKKTDEFVELNFKEAYRRPTREVNSLSTSYHDTSKKDAPQYSGDMIVGLSTMHKSNIVPVFKDTDPKIFAQMRRN